MKNYIYIITLILIGALGYNLYVLDYEAGFLAEDNLPILIGLGSSILGLIVALIFFSFFKLQKNIKNIKQ